MTKELLPDNFFSDEDFDSELLPSSTISSILRKNLFGPDGGETHWSMLYEVSDLINSQAYDFDATARSILDLVVSVMRADRGFLMLVDHNKDLYLKTAAGFAADVVSGSGFIKDLVERVLTDGQSVSVSNALDPAFPDAQRAQGFGAATFQMVPLRARIRGASAAAQERRQYVFQAMSQIMGVLYVDRRSGGVPYTQEQLDTFRSLSSHVTTVLINAKLYQLATVDGQTGFLRRAQLDTCLTVELTLAENTKAPLAVLMIDIERMHIVNQRFGNKEGDTLIVRVAQLLRRQLRDDDICLRYGGEQFLVVLPNTDARGARVVAQKLCTAVHRADHGLKGHQPTIGVGVALYPQHADNRHDLVKKADQALYQAKEDGGNRFHLWSEQLSAYSPRADQLVGIITGDQARDYHNTMMLMDTMAAINAQLPLAEMLSIIVDNVLSVTGAQRGVLMLYDGEELKVEIAQDRNRQAVRNLADFSLELPQRVGRTGNPVCFVDARTDPDRENAAPYRAVMCVPLLVRGAPIGVLYVDTSSRDRKYTESDLTFFKALAGSLATAIDRARLHDDVLKQKEEIQRLNLKLQERVQVQEQELVEVKEVLEHKLDQFALKYNYDKIVGKSPRMQEIYRLLDRITDVDVPVLVNGESGTGKELIATAIHYNGPRRARRFVSVNCAAISESLLESELFGHAKGAFTGAENDKKGLFELADRGTIFLDEVGDMTVTMQKKLLRVLQEGEIRPVGGKDVVRVNVRVISATNRDLRELMQLGEFRKDLYYRLNVVNIKLPPLRERKEDLPLLVKRFLADAGRDPESIDKKALAKIMRYGWPGNIRELKNYMDRLALMATGDTIGEEDVDLDVEGAGAKEQKAAAYFHLPYKEAKEAWGREYLLAALTRHKGNITAAARECEMVRSSFHKIMKKFAIEKVEE